MDRALGRGPCSLCSHSPSTPPSLAWTREGSTSPMCAHKHTEALSIPDEETEAQPWPGLKRVEPTLSATLLPPAPERRPPGAALPPLWEPPSGRGTCGTLQHGLNHTAPQWSFVGYSPLAFHPSNRKPGMGTGRAKFCSLLCHSPCGQNESHP